MSPFWRLARMMLQNRLAVAGTVVFVVISSSGLGAGLVLLLPMMQVLMPKDGDSTTLQQLAVEHNADSPVVAVPQWLIAELPADPFDSVKFIIAIIAVITVVGGFANFMHQYLSQTIAAKTIGRIRQRVFERVICMPLGRVVSTGPSQLVARIINDSSQLQSGFIALTSRFITHFTKGIAACIAAFLLDWQLTLVAMIALPVLAGAIRWLGKRIRRGMRRSLRAQEGLLRISTETLQGLRSVKANTAEQQSIDRFEAVNDEVVKQQLKIRTARAMSAPLMETLTTLAVAIIALIAAKLIIDEKLEVAPFLLTLGALGAAGAEFRPLASFITQIQTSAAPAERIIELLDEPIEDLTEDNLPALPLHKQTIEFKDISLTYPGASHPALRDVSFTVRHGERVAVVGPNGSGKTTLLGLVPRLLEPDAGAVLIDGTDVREVNLKSLRDQIGVVTQETMMFRGSIHDNISFGRSESMREQVTDAAKRAHAHRFIEKIPGGYDASVAEQGASLSGGQRQRIAIARALLRNPSILILDEATSQIDAESEEQINQALQEFSDDRTVLVIAHRLATVLNADRIVVMNEGRVADIGSHAELLDRCELYARLNRTQLGDVA